MKSFCVPKWRTKATAILMTFVLVLSMVPANVFAADTKDHTADPDISRTMAISYQLKGQEDYTPLSAPYNIEDITKVQGFRVSHSFRLADKEDEVTGEVSRSVHDGDYYLIDLPEKLVVTNPKDGEILGNGDRPIARYNFVEEAAGNWKIQITFTSYVEDPNEYDIYGEMNFDFSLDADAIGEGTTQQIYIPIDDKQGITLEVSKPVPPPTMPVSLTKTVAKKYNDETRELVWNVSIAPETGVFGGCVFTDTIDTGRCELKSIRHGSTELAEGVDNDYTYAPGTGTIVYAIPQGRDGKDYQNIQITTMVKPSVYGKLSPTEIINQANLSGGEDQVDIDSNTASQTITPNWLQKSGSPIEGNKIQWTLTANTTQQNMYNGVVTDHLQADVRLDKTTVKVGNAAVTVYDGTYTPANDTEIYGIYSENGDKTARLAIYLPRGKANASPAKQTITFVTSVTPPADAAGPSPTYNNTASMDANFTGEGDTEESIPRVELGQVGVSLPHISVVKGNQSITPDDKRNGTITWTIDAVSNLSGYGKTVLTDTLPEDQDYVPDEIYWGSKAIGPSTEPMAEISSDGRILTITFSDPEALASSQHFTVKTKIKTEVYGDNMNRTFNNAIKGVLYNVDGMKVLAENTDSHQVKIDNTVISKSVSVYKENSTKQGINPRVNFAITVNENLMPLSDVTVSDDLSKIVTEFKKTGDTSFQKADGVKWSYVPSSLKIKRVAGTLDRPELASSVEKNAAYDSEANLLTFDFGSGAVNDKYTISFTAELDVRQNDMFQENGSLRCKGNVGTIEGTGLKTGTISSPATGNTSEIKNEVLGKTGTHMVSEQQAVWTINLNQHKVKLKSTNVVDVLPEGLTLDPTSLKLYSNVIGGDGNFLSADEIASKGTPVDFTYTYLPAAMEGYEGQYVLTVALPDDNTAYTLQFATDIDKKLLGKKVSNSAYYAGDGGAPENTDTGSVTLSNASGGGSVSKTSVTVYKKSRDTGAALDTATFQLHWLKDGKEPVYVRTLSTDKGTAVFRGLTRGEQYTITETVAPEGYQLDHSQPVEFTAPADGTGDAEALTFYDTPIKAGSWTPAAVKRLDGKEILHSFRFQLKNGDAPVMNGVTKTELANGDYTVEFSLADGVTAKDVLDFTNSHVFKDTDPEGTSYLAETRTFTMNEIKESLPGYVFDKDEKTLNVKAYNVKGRESLKIEIEDDKGTLLSDDSGIFKQENTPVFMNTYRAEGSLRLKAEKTLIGHVLEAGQFSFQLYEGDTLLQTVSNDPGVLSSGQTYTGAVNFDSISYTQGDVGTKVYHIVEKNDALPGYTYDASDYTVTVDVSDNDDGTLTSTIQSISKEENGNTSSPDAIRFTNTYTASDIRVSLEGKKELTGRALSDGEFSFRLNQVTPEGEWIKEIAETTNESQKIVFPELTFTQEDMGKSYYYQISEVNGGKKGYTYDTSVYTIRVDVTDNDDGTLSAVQTITKNGGETENVLFTNQYEASGSTTVSGQKELTGKVLPEGQFTFSLQQVDAASSEPVGEKYTVKNEGDGTFAFPDLSYTEADAGKTFTYKISEENEGLSGYTYDGTTYTLRVQVEDNGDGTLQTRQTITQPENTAAIQFLNTYTVTDTYADFTARKYLEGRILEKGQFTFALIQTDADGTPLEEIQKVENDKDGLVTFDRIIYTQKDMGNTYYYQMKELNENNPGYGYDSSVYAIQVEVLDNGDGTMRTAETITRDDQVALSPVFTNSYTTTNATVALAAKKSLVGRTLAAGQFKFQLAERGEKDAGGQVKEEVIEEVTNGGNGSIPFKPLTYTQEDMGKTFIYTVKEVNDKQTGYTYDSGIYLIQVEVVDNGDGSLKARTTYNKISDDQPSSVVEMKFLNKYQAAKSSASSKPGSGKGTSLPKTGDRTPYHNYMVSLALAAAAILVLKKRVKKGR